MPLDRRGVQETEAERQLGPDIGRDPVGGPAGDLVRDVPGVEHGQPAALEVDVRHVDEPGSDQGLEDGGVAQSALGLLEVGTDTCASSPISWCRESTILRSSGSRSRAVRRHWASTWCAPGGSVGVAGEVPDISETEATRRSAAAASRTPEAVRTEWSSLVSESHSGYQICSAPGPSSTPSAPTSTTSRSEYGASSDRP